MSRNNVTLSSSMREVYEKFYSNALHYYRNGNISHAKLTQTAEYIGLIALKQRFPKSSM